MPAVMNSFFRCSISPALYFGIFCLFILLGGCAREQFKATTDLENFQKIYEQKEQDSEKAHRNITPLPPTAIVGAGGLGDYLLGPGDLITVTVFETEDLNAEVRVSSRGFVSLPLLNSVEVINLTAAEAEEKIENLYREKYLHDPHISVYIKEHVSKQITLVGAVASPGTYDYVTRRRLLDVIAIAQGLSDEAGAIAYVTREDSETKQMVNYLIDLDALIKQGNMEQNLVVLGGDVIFVPESGRCFIDGAVRKPGTYKLDTKMTITEGITLAGGLASFADTDSIKLIRYMGKGKQREIISLSYSDLQAGVGDSLFLRDQDIVFAESSATGTFMSGTGFSLGFMGTGINFKDPKARYDY